MKAMLQQFLEDKASSRAQTEVEKEGEVERPFVYPGHMRRIESYGSFTVSTFGRRDTNDSSSSINNNGRGSMQSRLDRSDRSLRSSGNSYDNIIRGDLSCFGEEYDVPTKKDKEQKTTFGTRVDTALRKSTGSMGDHLSHDWRVGGSEPEQRTAPEAAVEPVFHVQSGLDGR